VGVLFEDRRVGDTAGGGFQRVERGDERGATRPEPRRDRPFLRAGQQMPSQAAARQSHLPRGARDLGVEGIGDPGARPAHRMLPGGGP